MEKKGILEKYDEYQVQPVSHHIETPAVRANQMEFHGDEDGSFDDDKMHVALAKQGVLKERKRMTKSFRLKGGGRRASIQRPLERQLKRFFIEMRDDDLPVDMHAMIAQAHLFDPTNIKSTTLTSIRMRRDVYRVK